MILRSQTKYKLIKNFLLWFKTVINGRDFHIAFTKFFHYAFCAAKSAASFRKLF